MPYEEPINPEFPSVRNYGTEYANSGHTIADFKIGDRVVCVGLWDDQSLIVGEEGIIKAFNSGDIGVDFENSFGYASSDFGGLHELGGAIPTNTGWWLPAKMLAPSPWEVPSVEDIKVDFDSLFSESEV